VDGCSALCPYVLYFSLVACERGVNKKVTPNLVDSRDLTGWLDGMDQPFQGHWLD